MLVQGFVMEGEGMKAIIRFENGYSDVEVCISGKNSKLIDKLLESVRKAAKEYDQYINEH